MMVLNGHAVVLSVHYVTEPGEGWKGSRFVGEYANLEELNKALPDIIQDKPDYWNIEINFQDGGF